MKKFIRFQSILISLYFLYVKEILNLLDCVLRYSLRISQKKFAPLLIKCTYNCQNVHIRQMTDCITRLKDSNNHFILAFLYLLTRQISIIKKNINDLINDFVQ